MSAFEVTSKQNEGHALNLAVTLSSLTGRDGTIEGMLAIVRDTTAQRELEAQMHQSEKLTALGQMAGGIAHHFNNLLQAILGYAQLMGKNPSNVDVVRRGLDVIEKAATVGAETVRRIQKFARLRPEEAFVGLDLDQVIRDALAITRPRWEEKKIRAGLPLELELEFGSVPVVMGRPAELNEVVTNLILNAIDAMPHGGTLRIRTRVQDDKNVLFTVLDTGVGMTEDVRRRISDPFFTTKGEEGTGLGFPVSYSIVKRHGGEMRVESRPGAGTTFTVALPIGTSIPAEPPSEGEATSRRRGRILLVDNDPQVMSILGEMLGDAGHHVVPVGSGAEGPAGLRPGRLRPRDDQYRNGGNERLGARGADPRARPAGAADLHHRLGIAGAGPGALPRPRRVVAALQARAAGRAARHGTERACRRTKRHERLGRRVLTGRESPRRPPRGACPPGYRRSTIVAIPCPNPMHIV